MNESFRPEETVTLVQAVSRIACLPCRAVVMARFFDALAESLYPELARRQKTARLFETSAAWPDKTRVSIPQLKLHLEAMFSAEERSRSRLYKTVKEKQPEEGLSSAPGKEPFFYEWEEEARADEIPALQLTRWLSLLSAFCHLAASHPERAHELASRKDADCPHYQSNEGVFALAFPARFLENLALDCLKNLMEKGRFQKADGEALKKAAEKLSSFTPHFSGHKD